MREASFKPYKLILLCALTAALLSGCSARKVQSVRVEAEANQIIDVLGENGIRARKEEFGEGDRKIFQIYINGGDEELAAAIQLMEDHCLGEPEPPEIEGGTVITSIEVERAREQRRMKMNIESQLRKLPGVTCVNVNFVPPQDRSLAINPYPSTASVLVNYKTPTFPVGKDEIAALVARSVPALQPENVSVVISAKPLRPLPDNRLGYNFMRVALVTGIGMATILAFVSIVFFLQKKRQKEGSAEELDFDTVEETESNGEAALLDEGYVHTESSGVQNGSKV
jgi:type III secretory pathway lipoprotein EscJ